MGEDLGDIYNEVTKIMISFKIPFGFSGFDYLRKAILMCIEDEDLMTEVTNKLYPRLAKIFDTNQLHIERNIRSAIEKAYELDGLLALNEHCMQIVYKNEYKFTNSEMIYMIIEIVKLKLMKKDYIKNNCT